MPRHTLMMPVPDRLRLLAGVRSCPTTRATASRWEPSWRSTCTASRPHADSGLAMSTRRRSAARRCPSPDVQDSIAARPEEEESDPTPARARRRSPTRPTGGSRATPASPSPHLPLPSTRGLPRPLSNTPRSVRPRASHEAQADGHVVTRSPRLMTKSPAGLPANQSVRSRRAASSCSRDILVHARGGAAEGGPLGTSSRRSCRD